MHMADALTSPAVGGTMWAVSGGVIAFCAHCIQVGQSAGLRCSRSSRQDYRTWRGSNESG